MRASLMVHVGGGGEGIDLGRLNEVDNEDNIKLTL